MALLLALLLSVPRAAQAEPGVYEQRKIAAQALESFRRIMDLWRQEVYFELYDLGMESSKARISREDFAQRMVQLDWLPQGELDPKFLTAEYRFRTAVYISARIPYRNKFNASPPFSKDETILMLKEGGEWHVDLIQLIRSPFTQ